MTKSFQIISATCLVLLLFASNGFASYATTASYDSTSGVPLNRSYTDNALGAPDKYPFVSGSNIDFMSLGVDGSGIYTFGTKFTSSVTVYETSWGSRTGYLEYAEILGSTDGDKWSSLGYVNNQASDGSYTIDFAGVFSYLMIKDITTDAKNMLPSDVYMGAAANGDGFDVNAVSAQAATPIPGAVWLLGSGLIGLVGIRRKYV